MEKIIKMALMMLAQMRLAQRVSRISGAAKWAVLAAFSALGTVVALIAALWIFLIPRIGAQATALGMAGVFALLCLIFVLAARATLHPPHRDTEEESLADLKDVFSRHKGTALLSAVIAGLAMGNGKK